MSEFTELTPVETARTRLLDRLSRIERTESLSLAAADGRIAAVGITAERAIPHYERAAMDGYAVRAGDTTAASGRAPVEFSAAEAVGASTAVAVHTGSEMPAAADAVVPIEATKPTGGDGAILVTDSVPPGENVSPVGEDVAVGDVVVDAGERLTPAHLGLLRGVGVESVSVFERPSVAIIPTGDELVASDPAPGEIVETNSLVIGRAVERWGGHGEPHAPVIDDREELTAAIEGADADLVVTLGGTSVGERDVVPATVDAIGEMAVHGVGFRPGHPVGFGTVEERPVLTLPGYPVGCLVAAMLFLRPAIAHAGHRPERAPPTTEATLDRKIASELGVRTYARVALERDDADPDGTPTATPVRSRGSGVLSSVADADGWVVVSESAEGIPAGDLVSVEHWEGWP